MPTLSANLVLGRCPHCSVANPNLHREQHLDTNNHTANRKRTWSIYVCGSCGGVVTAWADAHNQEVQEHFPRSHQVDEDIPDRPRAFLQQANESLHAPAGAVMLAASAIDSMLKLKGYTDGTLYTRIQKAASEHVITSDMDVWAHEVRLDANDQRHADETAVLPSENGAQRTIDFAAALAEIMFVLPNRVQRGLHPKG